MRFDLEAFRQTKRFWWGKDPLRIALLGLILALTACAITPPYKPLTLLSGIACPNIFPPKAFRAVHQIEIESALTGRSIFIGAAKVEPAKDALHAVLMSVEGMVLFEAEIAGEDLRIISAFPPLNDPAFAKGMMADISFVMLKPAGQPLETGTDEQGLSACRWPTTAGNSLETALMPDGNIRLRLYDGQKQLMKEAVALPPFDRGTSARIRLQAFRPARYTIHLDLIEIEMGD